jgi:hypothetical protein
MSALALIVGLALLALTAGRLAGTLGVGSPAAFLVGAFVLAHGELLLVALALSLVRGFTPAPLLATLAALYGLTLLATRRRPRARVDWRGALETVRGEPVLLVLAAVVAVGLAYVVAVAIGVPQVEDDVITFHGVRAGLWRQHHGIAYLAGIFDLRNNAYPPGGELGALTTMTLASSDRFVALDQLLAALALAVGSAGIARRVGLGRREALFGGLLVVTLPIVVLQASTAMSDLIVAAFLLSAALFLVDGGRASPWLAVLATALAMDVKLTAPLGIPVLLALAWFARPSGRRRVRLLAVAAGAVAGAFWYAVNLAETGTWDGHVTEEFHVDRGPAPIVARIVRVGLEFVDVSGAVGRDRWLYAVAAALVLLVGAAVALRRRRRAPIVVGALAAVLAFVPSLLPTVNHQLVRAYFKAWVELGRRDLADLDTGHDLTRAASNFSWYGPLGSLALVAAAVLAVLAVRRGRLDRVAVLLVLAPAYWLVGFGIVFFYQEWAGRFFVFPVALAAATWGLLLRVRPAAWAATAIAATTLLVALANDARRPSGLPLLERDKPASIWTLPRWGAPELRRDYDPLLRFLDERIPSSAPVALATVPADPVYPFFGPGVDHRIVFVREGDREAPGADWVFVRPGRRLSLCRGEWVPVDVTRDGWRILHRTGSRDC